MNGLGRYKQKRTILVKQNKEKSNKNINKTKCGARSPTFSLIVACVTSCRMHFFFLLGFRLGVTCPALIYTCVMTSKAHKRYRWIARRDRHNQYACLSNKENSFASQFSNQKRIVGWKVSNVCEKSDLSLCAARHNHLFSDTDCLHDWVSARCVCVCVFACYT